MSQNERLPFTVLLPPDGGKIEVIDQVTNLRMGVVGQDDCADLPSEWEAPGIYVLLQRPRRDGSYHCYVGRASSLRRRLADHAVSRKFYRALLVRRESQLSLHATQINWLEADVYEMLRFARYAVLDNKQVPHEDSVPEYEVPLLARLRDPVMRVLHLVGHDVTVGPKLVNAADPSSTTLLDLVLAGQLHPGCPLRPVDDDLADVDAEITDDGRIAWGGRTWHYPSAAARAVLESAELETDGISGWQFWGVPTRTDGVVTLATFRDRYVHGMEQSEVGEPDEPVVADEADEPDADQVS